jgi:hypothetical protein
VVGVKGQRATRRPAVLAAVNQTQADPIEGYLAELEACLPARYAARVLAEAEDHLRESVAAGRAAGLTVREAQEAAISSFGSVRAVVRAHAERPRHPIKGNTPKQILADLVLSAWKLGATGLTAIGASGLVAVLMNATLGRAFVGQAPAGVTFPRASCQYWMASWPHATSCAQAAMLEASSDAVVTRLFAGAFGLMLLAAFYVIRWAQRETGRDTGPLLGGYYPALAGSLSGAGAIGLALAQLTGLRATEGPGNFLSGTIVAVIVAAWYFRQSRPVLRDLLGA